MQRHKGQRRLRIALAVLGCGFVAGASLGVLHSPLLSVHAVSVSGGRHTSRQAVLRATGLDRHPLMVDVDAGRLERRLDALPWVAWAKVARNWPSSVGISLHERVPAAVAVMADGEWAAVDASGRVLLRSTGTPPQLPSLGGLGQLAPPGSQLPASSAALRVLRALRQPLLGRVTAVDVLADDGLAIFLRPGIIVQLGDAAQLQRKLAAAQTVLSQVGASRVRTIDLRVPEAPAVTRG